MSSKVVIQAKNLTKNYQTYQKPPDRLKQILWGKKKKFYKEIGAIKDVSFEVRQGETLGVIGRNGAGKSTLLQIIAGVLNPTSGYIEINGRVAALLELGAGFNPEFSGRENVYLHASMMGFSRKQTDEIYDKIVSFAELAEFVDQPVKTYSSGMYARLAFASSIFVKPDILIVDEILAVGDAPFQKKCLNEFHKLRDIGCTILLVSHDAYLIKNFCERALYLRKGNVVAFGNSHAVVDKYMIEIEAALAQDRIENKIDSDQSRIASTDLTKLELFRITDVKLLDDDGNLTIMINSGQNMTIQFDYQSLTENPPKVTFVFSLYRHDGVYICGKTSLMDGIPVYDPGKKGTVAVKFSTIPLLAGKYYWRVAIDDDKGFGIYVEANNVCEFRVEDKMQAVGLISLTNTWSVKTEN